MVAFESIYWIPRGIACVILLVAVFGLTSIKSLNRRQLSYLVPISIAVIEITVAVFNGGDRLTYFVIIGCVLISLLYADTTGLLITIIISCGVTATYVFLFGKTLLPDSYSLEDDAFYFVALVLVSSLLFLVGKFSIGSLFKARYEADFANRAKSSFLAKMSHEIRTPMNSIIGVTEILSQSNDLPPKISEGLDRIYASSNLLLSIINDILDFSKIEAGKMDINPARYEMASLIIDATHLNMIMLESKPIDFVLDIDENIPAALIGDELRIKQLLSNLMSNAFKYTEKGRVSFSIYLEPTDTETSDVTILFKISDTGCGMTEDQLSRLFSEYSRFYQEGKVIEGTGLGLVITRNLVNLMGGEISVESEYGKGSVFTVRLPQKRAGNEVLGAEMVENLQFFRVSYAKKRNRRKTVRDPMPYGSVLVVDDVEANIYVAMGLLQPYQLKIESVSSGKAAIAKVKNGHTYDIIFMDHMMPDLDGMETTKRLRNVGYDKPIVALTANAVVGQADIFLQNGFDAFISKPIDIRQLDAILNKLIRDKQPPEVIEAARQNREIIVKEAPIFDPDLVIEGLDIRKGIEKFDGNEKTYLKVLSKYTANTHALLPWLEQVNEENLHDYRINVHGIKGSSYDIYADTLGDISKVLEEAAKNGDLDFIKKNNPTFLEIAWKLVVELEAMIKQINEANPRPKKDRPELDVLMKLVEACKSYSMNGVDAAMAEIDTFEYTSDGGLVTWIREQVNLMEFEEIINKLEGIIDGAEKNNIS